MILHPVRLSLEIIKEVQVKTDKWRLTYASVPQGLLCSDCCGVPPHHAFCYLFQGEGGPAGPAGPAGARGIPVSKIPSTSPVSKT